MPNRRYFQIAFPVVPDPVADIWATIVSILNANKCLPKKFLMSQIAGHPAHLKSERDLLVDADGVRQIIEDRNLDGFSVDTGHSENSVCYSLVHAKQMGKQTVLGCRVEDKAKAVNDWTPLIEAVMGQWSSIGAWQWDHFYRVWQWIRTVEGYERRFGLLPPGFRVYPQDESMEMSTPRKLIDVSLNPGRGKELCPHIHFYPTAEMWLGPHFWQYAACSKEEVLAADFFIEKKETPHFLYLKCWPHPFTRPDGEQGRMQQCLWKLFFHEDCEWPPGSGGISDVPVYGPPELLPVDL